MIKAKRTNLVFIAQGINPDPVKVKNILKSELANFFCKKALEQGLFESNAEFTKFKLMCKADGGGLSIEEMEKIKDDLRLPIMRSEHDKYVAIGGSSDWDDLDEAVLTYQRLIPRWLKRLRERGGIKEPKEKESFKNIIGQLEFSVRDALINEIPKPKKDILPPTDEEGIKLQQAREDEAGEGRGRVYKFPSGELDTTKRIK